MDKNYKVTLQMDVKLLSGELTREVLILDFRAYMEGKPVVMSRYIGDEKCVIHIKGITEAEVIQEAVYLKSSADAKLVNDHASEIEQQLGKHGLSVYGNMWTMLMEQLMDAVENVGLSTSSVRVRALLAHVGVAFMRNRKNVGDQVFMEKAEKLIDDAKHRYKLVFAANGEVWYKGFKELKEAESYSVQLSRKSNIVDFAIIGIYDEDTEDVLINEKVGDKETRMRAAMARSVIKNSVQELPFNLFDTVNSN